MALHAYRPQVSIIINNYNYGHLIAQAVDSALAQDYRDIEIIIVDDGSTDMSREVLERYRDRAKLVLKENGGQASALNAGVRASRGELLCFLDSDDWWTPHKVSAIVEVFAANPHAALAYHRLQPTLSDGRFVLRPIPRSLLSGNIAPRLSRSGGCWPFPMTSALAVPRRIWERVGEIPECFRISADAWLVGIYPFLGQVVSLPESLGNYRIHANSWYRAQDDGAMLGRRIAHWELVLERSNAFLRQEGLPWTLRIEDHLSWRVARTQLARAGALDWMGLAFASMVDEGEPSLPRRLRNGLRYLSRIPIWPHSAGLNGSAPR
ncbi:glycosyltransferase [Thioclava sp. BHET1]|nr:glycosyltransferase [Thioclava sp. BHET1]